MDEINVLRTKLHKKEMDYNHVKSMYTAQKKKIEEKTSLLETYKSEHEELIALRNHVYNYTEGDIQISPESIDEMKGFLLKQRIVLIGGHVNWTKKLRQIFPDWVYIDPDTSGGLSDNIVVNADRVYFYTNYIKHTTYYRVINIIREKNISFGYIHSVNIDSVIKQIYDDLK